MVASQRTKSPTTLSELNRQIWKCSICAGCDHPSMAGFFPKNMDVLVIGQNPGQLHKRDTGWDDSDYAFNDENFGQFQQDYAKGLFEAPIGKWLKVAFHNRVTWGLTNIVKCRTQGNFVGFEEIDNCRPWLEKQIRMLKPRVIVTLGAPAWQWWKIPIALDKAEYKVHSVNVPFFQGLLIPMYHPAYRQYKHDKWSRSGFDRVVALAQNKKLFTAAVNLNRIVGKGDVREILRDDV